MVNVEHKHIQQDPFRWKNIRKLHLLSLMYKKVSYLKHIIHKHSCHKKIWRGPGHGRPCKTFAPQKLGALGPHGFG